MEERVTPDQVRKIRTMATVIGWNDRRYHAWLTHVGGPRSTLELTRLQAHQVIELLEELERCSLAMRGRLVQVQQPPAAGGGRTDGRKSTPNHGDPRSHPQGVCRKSP